MYNKSFRWACKNKDLVKIYSKFLKEEGLYSSYDGNSMISYDTKKFYEKILPYLKHSDKINKTCFICKGQGKPPREYLKILKYLKENPLKTAKEISKDLKKSKIYSELNTLNKFGFISFKDYPYKFEIIAKGLKLLGA